MSIRSAAPNTTGRFPAHAFISPIHVRRTRQAAANDDDNKTDLPSDLMLKAALRHFAEHGLGAARAARAQAEQAFFANDRKSFDWWMGITRTLDRRLAAETEKNCQSQDLS